MRALLILVPYWLVTWPSFRRVREKALECLASVLGTKCSNLQKSILHQAYIFFDYHEGASVMGNNMADSKTAQLSPPVGEKTKLQMAIGCLGKSLCSILHRDGEFEIQFCHGMILIYGTGFSDLENGKSVMKIS